MPRLRLPAELPRGRCRTGFGDWPQTTIDVHFWRDVNGIRRMKDPYETLGVKRSATDKEIKDAFKKLARKFHPDLHPGDKEAETKFKDISAANDLLKDKEKRRRFDAGEIDASGAERPRERFYRDFADGPAYASHAAQDGFANNEELEEFLSHAFAAGGRRSQSTFQAR